MRVRDRMTRNPITVASNNSLKDALAIMMEKGFRKVPVMEDGALVGIIVQHDIEKALQRPGCYPETPVSWVMSKPVITVTPEDGLVRAAKILIEKRISGLPVLEGDRLVGIITDTDILKFFTKIMGRY